jgi:hypothetical protein
MVSGRIVDDPEVGPSSDSKLNRRKLRLLVEFGSNRFAAAAILNFRFPMTSLSKNLP